MSEIDLPCTSSAAPLKNTVLKSHTWPHVTSVPVLCYEIFTRHFAAGYGVKKKYTAPASVLPHVSSKVWVKYILQIAGWGHLWSSFKIKNPFKGILLPKSVPYWRGFKNDSGLAKGILIMSYLIIRIIFNKPEQAIEIHSKPKKGVHSKNGL